ncbi:hypothetical protein [Nocardioides sp. GXZ039]|uniref:hypothetical protein n=1 Tax=Nocardioides sp. GXZ039 TaxID=3136018 RepID=UPI0030F4383C
MNGVSDPHSSRLRFYRLAPTFAARVVGLGFVVVAILTFGYAAAAFAWSWPADVILLVAGVGLAIVLVVAAWLRSRAYVVRLDDLGYDVRLVRGVGVATGRWEDVVEVAAADPRGVACLVLHRRDGTATSIPVEMIAAPSDSFADDVRDRLTRAAGRRD